MAYRKFLYLLVYIIASMVFPINSGLAQSIIVRNNSRDKMIVFGNEKITITLDYNQKASLSSMVVNGQEVIQGPDGMYSAIWTKDNT